MYANDTARAGIRADTARDLAAGWRPSTWVAAARTMRRTRDAVAARYDDYLRRSIAERHERVARHHEVGGGFSIVP
jgi:hypothetical protein